MRKNARLPFLELPTQQLLSSILFYIQIFFRKGLYRSYDTSSHYNHPSLQTRNIILQCAKYYNSRAIPERSVLKSWQRRRSGDCRRVCCQGKRQERRKKERERERERAPGFCSQQEREREKENSGDRAALEYLLRHRQTSSPPGRGREVTTAGGI